MPQVTRAFSRRREALDRGTVGFAGEVPPKRGGEHGVVFTHLGKQSHGGVEFEVVRISKDLLDRSSLNRVDQVRALAQASSEHRVGQVIGRLYGAGDGKPLRHGARSKAPDLREDKPHPVGALLARRQLGTSLLVGGGLRVDESLEVMDLLGADLSVGHTQGGRRCSPVSWLAEEALSAGLRP